MYRNIFLLWIKKKIFIMIFSHVLRDSTPRFVRPSIGPSVRRSVGPSVRPSVREHESKSGKMSVFEYFLGSGPEGDEVL